MTSEINVKVNECQTMRYFTLMRIFEMDSLIEID